MFCCIFLSVKQQLFCVLGVLAEVFFEKMISHSERLLDLCVKGLKAEVCVNCSAAGSGHFISHYPCVVSLWSRIVKVLCLRVVFTPQPLRAVGYCFHPWCPDGRAGGQAGGKKFVWAVSQKP